MKKTLVLGFAALLAGNMAHAGDLSLSTDVTFASEYIFRGVRVGDNSLQPSIQISKDDLYGGIWVEQPLENRASEGWGDEIDLYFGYTPKVSDTLSLDLGATYYYYPTQGYSGGTTEMFAGANFTFDSLTPGIYAYYDLDLEAFTVQGNLGFSIPLDAAGTSLDLAASVGHVTPNHSDSYVYYSVGVSIPYKINENASVKVGVNWASNNLDGTDGDHLWMTAGLTVGF